MKKNYEPPTCPENSPMGVYKLYEGVKGYAIENRGKIYIPVVIAEKEGSGQVGKFIDSCSPRCVFPNITSERFRNMLERRGYKLTYEINDDEEVDVWVHPNRKETK